MQAPRYAVAQEPGALGLALETRESTNPNPPSRVRHKSSVPHPCDGFMAQGWESTNLDLLSSFGLRIYSPAIWRRVFQALAVIALLFAPILCAQAPTTDAAPLAIVPLDNAHPDQAAKVTGAIEVSHGKAVIAASGAITSGSETTPVTLPHRGVLRVCASTTVKLAADSSVPAGETPGLTMAMDHGAVELSFATGRNSDILLTPDFRILIGGPGAAEVKVRLGQHGDTCVDNTGVNAPYVLVSSVFEGGAFRVQPGQRVMFEHGSLRDVVDNEKEPCGCPPAAAKGNEFPLAQSEGLAPLPKPAPSPIVANSAQPQAIEPLVYKSEDHAPQPTADAQPAASPAKPAAKKKPGLLARIKKALRQAFGAE